MTHYFFITLFHSQHWYYCTVFIKTSWKGECFYFFQNWIAAFPRLWDLGKGERIWTLTRSTNLKEGEKTHITLSSFWKSCMVALYFQYWPQDCLKSSFPQTWQSSSLGCNPLSSPVYFRLHLSPVHAAHHSFINVKTL